MSEARRNRLTLVATILGSTIVFLDATVVQVALPALSDDLDAGLADQQWVVEAYLLALVTLLLVGGSLGDQFGRRRMFVMGLVGFGVTVISLPAVDSDSQPTLSDAVHASTPAPTVSVLAAGDEPP